MNENEDENKLGWFSENINDPEFQRGYEREAATEGFLEQVEQIMRDKDLSRTKLAQLMDCKPANITKVMRHTNNLKLSTMVDIAIALGHRVRINLEVSGVASQGAKFDGSWVPIQVGASSGLRREPSHRLWLVGSTNVRNCEIQDQEPLAA